MYYVIYVFDYEDYVRDYYGIIQFPTRDDAIEFAESIPFISNYIIELGG